MILRLDKWKRVMAHSELEIDESVLNDLNIELRKYREVETNNTVCIETLDELESLINQYRDGNYNNDKKVSHIFYPRHFLSLIDLVYDFIIEFVWDAKENIDDEDTIDHDYVWIDE